MKHEELTLTELKAWTKEARGIAYDDTIHKYIDICRR